MLRWDRYVLRPRVRAETSGSETVPHIGPYIYPLGRISLEVVFGNASNFRKEALDFEVVDSKSQYHAILGRPTFARFMAVPHYAYLKQRIPGPRGVITVNGSFVRSDRCD